MFITLKRDWKVLNGGPKDEKASYEQVVIPAGRHEIERIPNPYGYNAPWLVLKGTAHGMTEGSWREWVGEHLITNEAHPDFGKKTNYGEFEVVIEED